MNEWMFNDTPARKTDRYWVSGKGKEASLSHVVQHMSESGSVWGRSSSVGQFLISIHPMVIKTIKELNVKVT